MKKTIAELMKLCPGRLSIQLDYHKLFNETAEKFITDNSREVSGVTEDTLAKMRETNTIIFVQANPIDKPMEAKAYHYDLETALKDCLYQIKLWKPIKK